MKVLQIEDERWDSGIAHYALTLSAELKRRGHEVHFWGAKGSVPAKRAAELGLRTLELDSFWRSLPSLREVVRKEGIELINAHTGSSHSLAAAVAAGTKVPVVRTRGDARAPASHALTRALAHRTKAFIAANSRIQGQLTEAFAPARVELILQGIEAPLAGPLPEGAVFGLLGRLDEVKGHETFLAAASSLTKAFPSARFLAAGTGKPERVEELKAKLAPLHLSSSFEFLGFVPEVSSFLSRCRVGVVASTGSEAVSRAALEWMAAGRAVVASNVGGLPDLVEEGVTGFLVQPENPHALTAALRRFLDEPGLAVTMGAAGRKRYLSRFSLRPFGDLTERLYQDLLR